MSLPTDPEALFGAEALGDLRALRKAYSRLIRVHGPETDPEAFRQIREAFEAVRVRLEAGDPQVEPTPAAATQRTDEEWVRWLREPPGLTLERLRETCTDSAGPTAALLRFSAEAVVDPASTRERAVAFLADATLRPQAFLMLRVAFTADTRLLHDGYPAFAREVHAVLPDLAVDVARLDTLIQRREVPAAWAHWRELRGAFFAEAPRAAVERCESLWGLAAWEIPVDVFAAETRWLDDVSVQLPDDVRERLARSTLVDLACRRSLSDPEVPRALVAVVRSAYGGDGPSSAHGVLAALRDLRHEVPKLPEVLDTLSRQHPNLIAAVDRTLSHISGRMAFDAGTPAGLGDREELAAALGEVEDEVTRRRLPPPPVSFMENLRRLLPGRAVVAAAGVVPVYGEPFTRIAAVTMLGPLLLWGLVYLYRSNANRQVPNAISSLPAGVLRPPREDAAAAWARQRCFELQREHGAWLHELAQLAQASQLTAVSEAIDGMWRFRWNDLLAIDSEHIRRVGYANPEAS